jgi:hypothetical protein
MFAHARSHNAIRPILQFVTPGASDHEIVNQHPNDRISNSDQGKSDETRSGLNIDCRNSHGRVADIDFCWRKICDRPKIDLFRATVPPCFGPAKPENSLFLPRCGHGSGSHFAFGAGKWGDCQMITKASGLLAVLFAAGLFACVTVPSPVAAAGSGGTSASDSDSATTVKKLSTRHGKPDKSAKTESKSAESKSSGTKKPDGAEVADAAAATTALPASVANAKAELTPDSAISAKANTLLAASDKPDEAKAPGDADVVASDQLNEMDRALQESQQQNQPAAQPQQPAPAVAMTTAQAPTAAPVASTDDSTWDRTSLIGKIFIAAGALLTMASAARMFIA